MASESQVLFNFGIGTDEPSMRKGEKSAENTSQKIVKSLRNITTTAETVKRSISGNAAKAFGFIGLGLSIGSFVGAAHQANMKVNQWHVEMAGLSDSFGDAGKAVGIMTSAWGNSLGTMDEVRGSMKALNAAGLNVVHEGFKNLTVTVTNLSKSAGIGQDAIANFVGKSVKYWGASTAGAKEMLSAVMAGGEVFGLTSGQMEKMMTSATEIQDKMGAMFSDGAESSKALVKGLTASSGALIKMGVNAEQASTFMNKLLDVDQMGENNALMRRLGITFEEQIQMMESASGKELFFDKLMTNLPKLSQQISSIRNPMARLKFAKNLGLPLEIASKMAKSTGGEIRNLMQEYKNKAKQEDALDKKQQKSKADAARFEEQLEFLKMRIVMPLMKWLNKTGYGIFQRLLKGVERVGTFISESMVSLFNLAGRVFKPIFEAFEQGGGFEQVFFRVLKSIPQVIQNALGELRKFWDKNKQTLITVFKAVPKILKIMVKEVKAFWKANKNEIIPIIGEVISVVKDALWSAFKGMMEIPEVKMLFAGFAAFKIIPSLIQTLSGFAKGFTGKGLLSLLTGSGGSGLSTIKSIGTNLLKFKGALGIAAIAIGTVVAGFHGLSKAQENFSHLINGGKKTSHKVASFASGAIGMGMLPSGMKKRVAQNFAGDQELEKGDQKELAKLKAKVKSGRATKEEKQKFNDLIRSMNTSQAAYIAGAYIGGYGGAALGAAVAGPIGAAIGVQLGATLGTVIADKLIQSSRKDMALEERRMALLDKETTRILTKKEKAELIMINKMRDFGIDAEKKQLKSAEDNRLKAAAQISRQIQQLQRGAGADATLSGSDRTKAENERNKKIDDLKKSLSDLQENYPELLKKAQDHQASTGMADDNYSKRLIYGDTFNKENKKQFEALKEKYVKGKSMTEKEMALMNELIIKKNWMKKQTLTLEENSEREKIKQQLRLAKLGTIKLTKEEQRGLQDRIKVLNDKAGGLRAITKIEKDASQWAIKVAAENRKKNELAGNNDLETSIEHLAAARARDVKIAALESKSYWEGATANAAAALEELKSGDGEYSVQATQLRTILKAGDSSQEGAVASGQLDRLIQSGETKKIRDMAKAKKELVKDRQKIENEYLDDKKLADESRAKADAERLAMDKERNKLLKPIGGIGGNVDKMANKDKKQSGADFLKIFNQSMGAGNLKFTT